MKSKRRHELQHNELAEWLANAGETLKPYQNLIFVVVVLGLVGIGAYFWFTRSSSAQNEKAWTELDSSLKTGDLTELTQVIDKYRNTGAARMATVLSGDFHLINGCNQLFNIKEIGETELNRAILLFETELREGKHQSLLERATFGLAQAKEAKGELEEAERYYRQLVANWPDGAFAAAANQRLDDLGRTEIKKFYDKFRDDFRPKQVYSEGEFDVPGKRFEFDRQNVPEEKSIEFPDYDDQKKDDESKGEKKK